MKANLGNLAGPWLKSSKIHFTGGTCSTGEALDSPPIEKKRRGEERSARAVGGKSVSRQIDFPIQLACLVKQQVNNLEDESNICKLTRS